MALNKYMHPRNIYKTPPDFTELAIKFQEFLAISTIDIAGNVKINFKNAEALRTLSKVLMKKDFDLDIEMPLDRLVPAIPLRLNYILWLEDIIEILNIPNNENIHGIDIGCGATCIYSLLASQKNNWKMIASESDELSFQTAQRNIMHNKKSEMIQCSVHIPKYFLRNKLKEPISFYIIVYHNTSSHLLVDLPFASDQVYTFTMCNPPFFASDKELDHLSNARTSNRAPPKAAQTGTENELVAPGGEIGFVNSMVQESEKLKTRISVFTTMLGHKSSVNPIKNSIKKNGAKHIAQTRFCQGRTMRWAIAWTFQDLPLQRVPDHSQAIKRNTHSLMFIIPKMNSTEKENMYTLQNVQRIIEIILDKLQVTYQILEQFSSRVTFEITAYKNTWSHQRRLRRQQIHEQIDDTSSTTTNSDLNRNQELLNIYEKGKKRCSNEDVPANKRTKLEVYLKMAMCIEQEFIETYDESEQEKCEVNGCLESTNITLKLGYLSGLAGKDGVHQIMQYIMNNWNKY